MMDDEELLPDEVYDETPAERKYGLLREVMVILLVVPLILTAMAGGVSVFEQGTWLYSNQRLDSTTTDRLAQLHLELAMAGAPEAALRSVAAAARPGRFLGEAIEELANADEALKLASSTPAIAAAREELRTIRSELYQKQYWQPPTPTPKVRPNL